MSSTSNATKALLNAILSRTQSDEIAVAILDELGTSRLDKTVAEHYRGVALNHPELMGHIKRDAARAVLVAGHTRNEQLQHALAADRRKTVRDALVENPHLLGSTAKMLWPLYATAERTTPLIPFKVLSFIDPEQAAELVRPALAAASAFPYGERAETCLPAPVRGSRYLHLLAAKIAELDDAADFVRSDVPELFTVFLLRQFARDAQRDPRLKSRWVTAANNVFNGNYGFWALHTYMTVRQPSSEPVLIDEVIAEALRAGSSWIAEMKFSTARSWSLTGKVRIGPVSHPDTVDPATPDAAPLISKLPLVTPGLPRRHFSSAAVFHTTVDALRHRPEWVSMLVTSAVADHIGDPAAAELETSGDFEAALWFAVNNYETLTPTVFDRVVGTAVHGLYTTLTGDHGIEMRSASVLEILADVFDALPPHRLEQQTTITRAIIAAIDDSPSRARYKRFDHWLSEQHAAGLPDDELAAAVYLWVWYNTVRIGSRTSLYTLFFASDELRDMLVSDLPTAIRDTAITRCAAVAKHSGDFVRLYAYYLDHRVATLPGFGLDQIRVLLGLLPDWEGSVTDLLTTALLVTGVDDTVIDAPAEPDGAEPSAATAQVMEPVAVEPEGDDLGLTDEPPPAPLTVAVSQQLQLV